MDSGHLVFQRGAAVFAQSFSPSTSTVSGEPARLADDVLAEGATGHGLFDASRNGVLIYFSSSQGGTSSGEELWELQMQWADRSGQVNPNIAAECELAWVTAKPIPKQEKKG